MGIFGAVFGWAYSRYYGEWEVVLKWYTVFKLTAKLMACRLRIALLEVELRVRTACMEGHFRPWRRRH